MVLSIFLQWFAIQISNSNISSQNHNLWSYKSGSTRSFLFFSQKSSAVLVKLTHSFSRLNHLNLEYLIHFLFLIEIQHILPPIYQYFFNVLKFKLVIWTFLHINTIFEATILDQPDCYSNHCQNLWLPWQSWHTPFCKVI